MPQSKFLPKKLAPNYENALAVFERRNCAMQFIFLPYRGWRGTVRTPSGEPFSFEGDKRLLDFMDWTTGLAVSWFPDDFARGPEDG